MTRTQLIKGLLYLLEHGDPGTILADIELLLEGVGAADELPASLVDDLIGWAHDVKRAHDQQVRFVLWLKDLEEEEGDSEKKYAPSPRM